MSAEKLHSVPEEKAFEPAESFLPKTSENLIDRINNNPRLHIFNKAVRNALIGAQVIGLTLTSAGCVGAIQTVERATAIAPTPTATMTETPTVTPTQTEIPTVIPTETPEPTKTAAEETSRYFQPEFQLNLEGNVDGISIPFTVGLHKSIMERAEEPIKTISVNREDAPDRYAKLWLQYCWRKYVQQNPNKSGISFTEYEELVKNGEGEIQVAAVDESIDDQNNKILTFHPEKGFVTILVDRSVRLPEDGNTLSSFYLGMNNKGQLVVAFNFIWKEIISEQRSYDGYDGWRGSDMVDLVVSDDIAIGLGYFMVTNNDGLISQKPYWKVAGMVDFAEATSLMLPLIHDTQLSNRETLLTIQK